MITVQREDVKRKLRLSGTAYDSDIDALIDEMVPAIRYAIDPVYLQSPDPDLLALLNLGALELVAGEMSATLWREVGADAMGRSAAEAVVIARRLTEEMP